MCASVHFSPQKCMRRSSRLHLLFAMAEHFWPVVLRVEAGLGIFLKPEAVAKMRRQERIDAIQRGPGKVSECHRVASPKCRLEPP